MMINIAPITALSTSHFLYTNADGQSVVLPKVFTLAQFGNDVIAHSKFETAVGQAIHLKYGETKIDDVLPASIDDLITGLQGLMVSAAGGATPESVTAVANDVTALTALVESEIGKPTTIIVPGDIKIVIGQFWKNKTGSNIVIPSNPTLADLITAGLQPNPNLDFIVPVAASTLLINTNHTLIPGATYAMPNAATVDVTDGQPWVLVRRDQTAAASTLTGSFRANVAGGGGDLATVDPVVGNTAYILSRDAVAANRRWEEANP